MSMANGTVAMLQRTENGAWNMDNVKVLDLEGQPHHSVRCLCVVNDTVWCGFRNRIHVLSAHSLTLTVSLFIYVHYCILLFYV